ncbi:hypothetical protein HD554DRAFT_2040445 [Boletus coccyginus]|nr:hypothetical protein HD554DRAFT_2040445 [Boletus coccyginus]
MGLFYAYLKNSPDDIVYRYLITFESRDAADEWWRMISTAPSPYAANIQRTSPQFYTQSVALGNVVNSFTNGSFAPPKLFLTKMFFTLLNDRDGRIMSVAPPIDITDHLNGQWYFIRSQSDTHRYWYFRDGGVCLVCGDAACRAVHVSTRCRSRFRVRIDDANASNKLILIGSDDILISTPNGYTLRIDDTGDLVGTKVAGTVTNLEFHDFKDRFGTREDSKLANGDICEHVIAVERGVGQDWELVD